MTIPSGEAAARSHYPWIAFEGRWGELQPAFFNGPEGPNLKEQWTHPITWAQDWRSRSYTVPGSTVFGAGATGFFCTAVAHGSRSLVQLVANPVAFSLVLGGIVLVVLFLISRTAWRPTAPLRLAHRRAWGQTLAASGRMYLAQWPLFVGIGLLFVPIGLLDLAPPSAPAAHDERAWPRGGTRQRRPGGVRRARARDDAHAARGWAWSRPRPPKRCSRSTPDHRVRAAPGVPALPRACTSDSSEALLIAVVAVSLLASSLYLLPIAVWLAGRWALVVARGRAGGRRRARRAPPQPPPRQRDIG